MAALADVINDITIDNFLKVGWHNAYNHNPSLALLKRKGHVRRATGGDVVTWPIQVGNFAPDTVHSDEDVNSKYVPIKLHKQAQLNWGEKAVFTRYGKGAMRQNRGPEALVEYRDQMIPNMIKSMLTQGKTGAVTAGRWSMAGDFVALNGGSYSGSGLPLYGLPSIFQFDTGSTAKEATVTSGATYAGLSLEEDGLTGVDFPDSFAWTPKGINSHDDDWAIDTSTDGFGTVSSGTYAALEILSYAISSVTYDPADDDQKPDCGLMHKNHFEVLRRALTASQQIYVTKAVKEGDVFGLGTSVEYAMHDGLPFYWDGNMPTDVTYVLNFNQIWMDYLPRVGPISADKFDGSRKPKSNGKYDVIDTEMFEIEVDYDRGRRGVTVSVTFPGQFRINPKFQAKIADFS